MTSQAEVWRDRAVGGKEALGLPRLTELTAPLPDRFISHDDAAGERSRLHIAVAEAEAARQPDAMADDFGRKAMIVIVRGR